MRLSCVHCGKLFTITAEQLGGRGHCPHCRGEIRLPEVADGVETQPVTELVEQHHWWENSISGLVSLVFHMVLMLVLALITYGSPGVGGAGEDVLIGDLPSIALNDGQDQEELRAEPLSASEVAESSAEEMMDVEPPVNATPETGLDESVTALVPSLSGASPSMSGGDSGSFSLGAVSIGGGSGGGWEGLVGTLRRQGLDIVICFDSTASMGGEIRQVKEQIRRIGDTLLKLIPSAKISICTYRDDRDEYVVKGMPLSGDIQEISNYLASIGPGGGGDTPEAVHRGLQWAVTNNRFRSSARKVILVFGDAPPHSQHMGTCLAIASDFARQEKGIVSTVTCRRPIPLREFEEIAQAGGGEAFLTADERDIMTQLMVLVFGSAYREKVLEAFKLLGR
jgi:hypothetical protein